MKLSAQQQLEIRQYLETVTVAKADVDELLDHVLSGIEARPSAEAFDMSGIKRQIDDELNMLVNTEEEVRWYQRINNLTGFALFFVALTVYWLTMEPTVSFWDCGEFIAAAFKMEVGHQPGAPVFLMVGKLFSLLAGSNTARVAYWINFSSVVASAATIMFLFWTITALARKAIAHKKLREQVGAIITAGVIGALSYTFSDTFWFSAVEAEVYALSSLFTAITFWAMLRWENTNNDRWLVLIAFLMGLSTGVHLLNLLSIPALSLVYYYKHAKTTSVLGAFKAFLIGCAALAVIQFGIIQYTVYGAFKLDLLFVNGLGLSLGSGAIAFVIMIAALLTAAIYYTMRKGYYQLNLALTCTVFILLGFSSYLAILIRADAKPTINLSNPDNPYALYSYLGRTNYIAAPLLFGNTFDAKTTENEETGNTYRVDGGKYEPSGHTYDTRYDKNLLFPRTYSQKPQHAEFYKEWMGLDDGQTPTFFQNLGFFTSWQVGVMYWRYFLWNFAGRQNDIQGYGDREFGNWITGIKPLDTLRLGNQSDLPPSVTTNEGHNVFYGLPLLLGVAGVFFLFRRNKKMAVVLSTLFFFTGLAIILYLNQDPLQVRERDYAYAGSFYTFAIFIGFGFLWVKDKLERISPREIALVSATVVCFLAVPFLMAKEGWDDHNRSGRTTARDWARNYLNSCAPNAILFTNADNDTYPLWYAQEVEGIRTDVRVICLQFLQDASFIDQLKNKVNTSDSLPITVAHSEYKTGVRDFFPYVDYGITDSVELSDLLAVMRSNNQSDQVQMMDGSYMNFLPTRNLKLSIDADQLVDTGTIRPEQKTDVVPAMEWQFNNTYASKADFIMFDILANNNWERPIYFATSVSEDTYIGLDQYLYLEGYAYRLLPIQKADGKTNKVERTNTDVMYRNLMNKFDLTAFHQAAYLDVESRRIINSTWQFTNTLSENLLEEGKPEEASRLMARGLRDLPSRNYTLTDTLIRVRTIGNLYGTKQIKEANQLATATTEFIKDELLYINSLDHKQILSRENDIQVGLYVLEELAQMSEHYQQEKLHRMVEETNKRLLKAFNVAG